MTQFAYPNGDITIDGWEGDSGETTNLYQLINSVSETDWIVQTSNTTDEYEASLQNVTDPETGSSHRIRIRAKADSADKTVILQIRLMQGTTEIESYSETLTTSWATYIHTLTTAEANSITDYTDLRIEILQTQGTEPPGQRSYAEVAWMRFECPNAPPPPPPRRIFIT